MQTDFSVEQLASDSGARANEILRSCVHCGFCNATCPTYQLTGDELDGPRGRIYLIRELLQSGENEERAIRHLDRCLTCRACETTCPSGVAYGDLLDIARTRLGPLRKGFAGRTRALLKWMIPHPARLRALVRLGYMFRRMLPGLLADHLPEHVGVPLRVDVDGADKVLLLNGCAQQVHTGGTNEHLARLLMRHDVGVVTLAEEVCCGSLDLHLGDVGRAQQFARRNVDAMYSRLHEIDAIISTASGCGVTCKDYGRLLAGDEQYAEKASAVAAKTLDVSEYLTNSALNLRRVKDEIRIAWQSPCSLQHGQGISGAVEKLLTVAGYELTTVPDAHLCCGSAGTYSVLEPQLSAQLRYNKLAALNSGAPELIATANVGCQTHLGAGSEIPVIHWIELLE